MRFLKHNWQVKLLSLAVAVMMAIHVRRQEEPLRTSILLPINIAAPAGQRVAEPRPGFQVRVDLEGPAEVVRKIGSDEVALKLDTSNVKPGERTLVPVNVELPAKYQERVMVDWRPRTVAVKLQSDASRPFSVTVKVLNPSDRWEFTDPPRTTPPQVTAAGTESAVARVASVVAPLTLEETTRINALVTLRAVDAEGNDVTDQVQLQPNQVVVTGFQQRVVVQKSVPVQPLFHVPAGARVTVKVTPARARLIGPERSVASIYVVETEPVQLPAGQTQVTQDVALVVPKKQLTLTPSRVRVTIQVETTGARPAPADTEPH